MKLYVFWYKCIVPGESTKALARIFLDKTKATERCNQMNAAMDAEERSAFTYYLQEIEATE